MASPRDENCYPASVQAFLFHLLTQVSLGLPVIKDHKLCPASFGKHRLADLRLKVRNSERWVERHYDLTEFSQPRVSSFLQKIYGCDMTPEQQLRNDSSFQRGDLRSQLDQLAHKSRSDLQQGISRLAEVRCSDPTLSDL